MRRYSASSRTIAKASAHGGQAYLLPADIAEALLAMQQLAAASRGAEMHEADRLLRRAAARAGDAGDGDRDVGA